MLNSWLSALLYKVFTIQNFWGKLECTDPDLFIYWFISDIERREGDEKIRVKSSLFWNEVWPNGGKTFAYWYLCSFLLLQNWSNYIFALLFYFAVQQPEGFLWLNCKALFWENKRQEECYPSSEKCIPFICFSPVPS